VVGISTQTNPTGELPHGAASLVSMVAPSAVTVARVTTALASYTYYNGHTAKPLEGVVLEALYSYADKDKALEFLSQMTANPSTMRTN